jgi:hypothetical protein
VLVAARDARVARVVATPRRARPTRSSGLPKIEETIGRPPVAVRRHQVCSNELYADVFQRCYGLSPSGLRYFNVFGPRQDPEGAYAAVIPNVVAAMLRGEAVRIHGDGETTRDFCYIANVVQANVLAAHGRGRGVGEVYNVAVGGTHVAQRARANAARSIGDAHPGLRVPAPVHGEFRAGDVRHSQADIGKAQRLLGYAPTHDVRTGSAPRRCRGTSAQMRAAGCARSRHGRRAARESQRACRRARCALLLARGAPPRSPTSCASAAIAARRARRSPTSMAKGVRRIRSARARSIARPRARRRCRRAVQPRLDVRQRSRHRPRLRRGGVAVRARRGRRSCAGRKGAAAVPRRAAALPIASPTPAATSPACRSTSCARSRPVRDLPPWKQKIADVVTKVAPAYGIEPRLALAVISGRVELRSHGALGEGRARAHAADSRDGRSASRSATRTTSATTCAAACRTCAGCSRTTAARSASRRPRTTPGEGAVDRYGGVPP